MWLFLKVFHLPAAQTLKHLVRSFISKYSAHCRSVQIVSDIETPGIVSVELNCIADTESTDIRVLIHADTLQGQLVQVPLFSGFACAVRQAALIKAF